MAPKEVVLDVTCLMPEKISGIGIYTKYLYESLLKLGARVVPVVKSSRSLKQSFVNLHISRVAYPFWFYELRKMYSGEAVVHGPDFQLPTSSGRYKKVVTIHDLAVFHEGFNRQDFRARGQSQIKKLLFEQKPEVIIVPTIYVKNEVIKMFPDYEGRVFSIHHGGDHLLRMEDAEVNDRSSAAPGRPFYLFIGSFEHRKNLLNIISAFEKFCEQTTNFDLYLVGRDGFGAEEIRDKISNSKFKDLIIDKGFVRDNDLVHFYRHARAFVFPSVYEGFGFPILEAMALQCPVVTSSHGAMKEVAGEAAYFVDHTSAEEIKEAFEFFSTDDVSRMAYILKGMERVKDFSWERAAKRTLEVYGF